MTHERTMTAPVRGPSSFRATATLKVQAAALRRLRLFLLYYWLTEGKLDHGLARHVLRALRERVRKLVDGCPCG